jgi:hypothetical protein
MRNSILLNGSTLTPAQLDMVKFFKKSDRNWLCKHSFYFTTDGLSISTDPKEYYPVMNSTKDDVNPL